MTTSVEQEHARNQSDVKLIRQFPGMLSENQRAEIAKLLYNKLGNRKCEMCDSEGWVINQTLVGHFVVLLNDKTGLPEQDLSLQMPMILVTCGNCGNSKTFMPEKLGFDYLPVDILRE